LHGAVVTLTPLHVHLSGTLHNYTAIYFVHPQVYDGPTSTRQDSRPRRYATGYPEPKTRTGDDAIGKIEPVNLRQHANL
jgi:hypothetical protein